ncbi:MAG: hypothetical protein RJA44_2186 [Pseudomonadota bacterium]
MERQDSAGPLQVLLIEDNRGDVLLLQEAIRATGSGHTLHHVADGEAALRFLSRSGEHECAIEPDLILLDLNLPLLDGRQLLAVIKRHPQWCHIPVVVLSGSDSQIDQLATYKMHATGYVTKPADLDEFHLIASSLDQLWRSILSGRSGRPLPMPQWAAWPWSR